MAGAPGIAPPVDGDYMAPWIDTDQCTTCDECTNINKKIFVYNDKKKAIIKDPEGRSVSRHRQGCREVHRTSHPSGSSGRPLRERHREVDQARREVQLEDSYR